MPLNTNDNSCYKKAKEIAESVTLSRRAIMDSQDLHEETTEIRPAAALSNVGNENITVESDEKTKNVKVKSMKGNAEIISTISKNGMEMEYGDENSSQDSNENINVLSIEEHESPSIDTSTRNEKTSLQRSITTEIKKAKVLHEMEIADLERNMVQEKQKGRGKVRLELRLSHRRAARRPSVRIPIASNGNGVERKFSAPKVFIDGAKLNHLLETNRASTIMEGEGNSHEELERHITMNDMTPDERRHSRRLSMSRRLSQQLNGSSAITSDEGQVMDHENDDRNESNLGNVLSSVQNLKEDGSSIEDLDAILNSPTASSQISTTNTAINNLTKSNSQKCKLKLKKKKKIHTKKKSQKRMMVAGPPEDLEHELCTKNGKKEDTDVNLNVLDDLEILDCNNKNINVNNPKLKKKKSKKKKN